ncbi:MAG: hypothetical protein BMS9Abin05_1219 [Rhodothermia bacterium]|nr:MAG: hypothetical protein BMS9Abin05_1219 [Rhodothermia bacterium]
MSSTQERLGKHEQVAYAVAPIPTLEITRLSERGIETMGGVVPGEHTVAVYFEDQLFHENFLVHDVHLARNTMTPTFRS